MRVRFERDDGATLKLTPEYGYYEQATEDYLPAKTLRTSMFNFSGTDGGAMVKQSYEPWAIKFSGYIHSQNSWASRGALAGFFGRGHYFSIIFTRNDGREMIGRNAWLSNAPEIKLRHKNEDAQTYSFELTLGDPYFYDYDNNVADGGYANRVVLMRGKAATSNGGRMYGSGGYIYYDGGYMYSDGAPARAFINRVDVGSTLDVKPVFQIDGEASNIKIYSLTTHQQMTFNGKVPAGSTLTINCATRRALIGNTDLTEKLAGDSNMTLRMGRNEIRLDYTADKDTINAMMWNGVVE